MRKSAKSLEQWLPSGAGDGGVSARRLVSEIKSQWLRGAPADAQRVLAEHPELGSDKSAVLDLAYEEYCLRQQAGSSPDPDEFCQRFPHYKTSLRRLIEAHHCVDVLAPIDNALTSWPEAGDSFLGFVLRRELGRGAFARVFLANETAVGDRHVVVKISRHGAAEANLLGRLDGHPNVVPVLSVKREELSGWTAVCMPYLGSATLCDVIDEAFAGPGLPWDARVILEAAQRPCPAGEPVSRAAPHRLLRRGTYIDGVLHLAAQLAEGLGFVQAQGICHGDLKPSNVLLAPDGRPMLMDFNLSFDSRQTSQRLGGTLPYMAPEQLSADAWERRPTPLDVRSDLFAFGVLLYELLTGQHPFGPIPARGPVAEVRAQLLGRQRRGARPVRQLNPCVPRRLARTVGQCLAFVPGDRPRSLDHVCRELCQDLRRPRVLGRWIARRPARALRAILIPVLLLAGGVLGVYAPGLWQSYQQQRRLTSGRELIRQEDYIGAIGNLTPFIEVNPTNPEARFLRAWAYFRTRSLPEAVGDLTEGAARDPDGRINAFLGFVAQVQHTPKKAIPYYLVAIEKGFGPAEVYNNLGYCYLRTGRLHKATFCLDQSVKLNPGLQAGRYNRAYLSLMKDSHELGEIAKSLRDMEAAVELGPRTATLYRNAASLYALATESDPAYRDRAFFYLNKAAEVGIDPREFENDNRFTILRNSPRFQKLIREAPAYPPLLPEADLHLADLARILAVR